jgi:hypothetical protein
MMQVSYNHFWSKCDLCGDRVICGNCGNNACNGGVGRYKDGTTCPACDSAYKIMQADDPKKILIPLSQWPSFPNPFDD